MLTGALLPLLMLAADDGGVELNGFVSNRGQLVLPSEDALLSTQDLPIFSDLSEVNVQARARFLDEKLRFGVDYSAFLLFAGGFADADAAFGALKWLDEDAAAAKDRNLASAFVSLSEAWASVEPMEHLVVTLGKKRTVWGPGIAASPTDLLNPLRDPTDPSLQRAGFWQLRTDVPFEHFTVTALVSPQVLEQQASIPTQMLLDDDDDAHVAAALRGYALVGDADMNAWLLWTNRYNDDFENKARLAFTLSKSMFTSEEFHAEVLLQTGSARSTINRDCVSSPQALGACRFFDTAVATQDKLDEDFLYPEILVGWRSMPDDGSMFSIEYLYQADGYLRSEFDDVARLMHIVGGFQRAGAPVPVPSLSGAVGVGQGEGVPTRLSFQPLRRHYLYLTYTKPQVMDDFTLTGTLITPLEDLSSVVSGSVQWQAREWLTLSVFGFVPMPSPARVSTDLSGDPYEDFYRSVPVEWRGWVPRGALVDGVPTGEFDLAPFEAQLMFEMRAFF